MWFSRLRRPFPPHPVKDAALLMMQQRETQCNVFLSEGSQPGAGLRGKVCLNVLFSSSQSGKCGPVVVRRFDTVSLTTWDVVFAARRNQPLEHCWHRSTLNYVFCAGGGEQHLDVYLCFHVGESVARWVHRDFSCMSPEPANVWIYPLGRREGLPTLACPQEGIDYPHQWQLKSNTIFH